MEQDKKGVIPKIGEVWEYEGQGYYRINEYTHKDENDIPILVRLSKILDEKYRSCETEVAGYAIIHFNLNTWKRVSRQDLEKYGIAYEPKILKINLNFKK